MSLVNDRTGTTVNMSNVTLGVILIAAPWLFGFTDKTWAARNAWFSGGVVVLLALLALVRTYDWEEWLNIIAGLWVAASPWLLWFNDVVPALWTHVVIGLCIILFAALELRHIYLAPKDMTVTRR